jgi:hypothetical protein
MAGTRVSAVRAWYEAESAGAPEALRARAAHYLEAAPTDVDPASGLALAASRALSATLAQPGGRGVALDLLAADALVTLALKAQAERDPSGLAQFAARLRAAHAAPR